MTRTVKGLAKDQRILGALENGPLTANEIADKLRLEVWTTWAERHGYEWIEWGDPRGGRGPEEPVGARIMAFSEADEMGLPYLFSHAVYARLRGLEQRGEVARVQIEGRKPILWRLP